MRGMIILGGVAMTLSWGLTWLEMPFAGRDISPMAALRDGMISLSSETPWQTWIFVGGFACAALAAFIAMLGRGSGIFALLAGLSPLVLIGDLLLRADDLRLRLGLPFEIDLSDLGQAWDLIGDFLRLGLWAYLGGALLLLLAGLSVLSRPRR